MIFLVSVFASALAFGLWPAVTAAALAALTFNFFFLDPRLTLYIAHASDLFTFVVFFVVAMTTGWLTGRVRDQSRAASRRASAVAALLAASRRLSGAATRDEAAQALAQVGSWASANGKQLAISYTIPVLPMPSLRVTGIFVADSTVCAAISPST